MLDYNEIKPKKYIVLDEAPYEVLTAHVFRKQQRKPVNVTKLRNLLTGSVREHSFAVSDKVEEAEIEKREIIYLYTNRGESWFAEAADKSKRFPLPEDSVAAKIKFIKTNSTVELLTFKSDDHSDEQILGLEIPIKVSLKVQEAPPSIKGNTAQGGMKAVTLETGLMIQTPLFVNAGDTIVVNTEKGEYVERE